MKNNYLGDAPYLRNSVGYDHDFRYTIENDDISKSFFHFFLNFDFLGF